MEVGRGFTLSKPIPRDILSPAGPPLLNLSKLCHGATHWGPRIEIPEPVGTFLTQTIVPFLPGPLLPVASLYATSCLWI